MSPVAGGASAGPSKAPLVALGGLSLVLGSVAGLARLGAVSVAALSPLDHGPLMVGGFLGTVIALERAVASGRRWALLAPALCGGGTLALTGGAPLAGALALCAGSALVLGLLAVVVRADPALHHLALTAAAAAWLAGNVGLALGRPVFQVVPLWVVFVVGTVAAERLELSRLLQHSARTRAVFSLWLGVLGVGGLVALVFPDGGMRTLGVGALGLAWWLLRHDVARRTVRQQGQVRFIAFALLSGAAWLLAGGALAVAFGNPLAGPHYDAVLHAFFVGFVFSMIFGHAPLVLGAVLGVRVAYHPRFYAHLGLLHVSLLARVVGDLAGQSTLRTAGAWANLVAIALFVGHTVLGARRASGRLTPAAAV